MKYTVHSEPICQTMKEKGNVSKQLKVSFVVYADFEIILKRH